MHTVPDVSSRGKRREQTLPRNQTHPASNVQQSFSVSASWLMKWNNFLPMLLHVCPNFETPGLSNFLAVSACFSQVELVQDLVSNSCFIIIFINLPCGLQLYTMPIKLASFLFYSTKLFSKDFLCMYLLRITPGTLSNRPRQLQHRSYT